MIELVQELLDRYMALMGVDLPEAIREVCADMRWILKQEAANRQA